METTQSAPEDAQIPATAPAPAIAVNQPINETATVAPSSASSTASSDGAASSSASTPSAPGPKKAPASTPLVIMRAVAQLRPHDENAKIYGDKESVDDLCTSISRNNTGVLEALLITEDGRVISGHRRYRAALKLGLMEVPVRIFESEDEIEILNALLEHNRHRIKTKSQIANEAGLRLRIEKERAAQAKNGATGTGEKLPPRKNGKARDAAGKAVGISGRSADKAAKAADAVVKLRAEGKADAADTVEAALNKGYDTGYKAAVASGAIPQPKARRKPSVKKEALDETPVPIPPPSDRKSIEEKVSGLPAATAQLPPPPTITARLDSDQALTFADHAVTFLRECEMLTPEQQRAWGKLIDQLNRYRKSLGF